MPDLVRITDVSPRDGLQNEPGIIPTSDKVRLIELLCQTGVDEIEVTSFVSPKWVPQLGDARHVLESIACVPRKGAAWGSLVPGFAALVPNERGAQDAMSFAAPNGSTPQAGVLQKVAFFTAASETFARKNTNVSISESLDRLKQVLSVTSGAFACRAYVSCVIACPFEGPMAPERVAKVVGDIWELGVEEIDLGDTIGAGTPETVSAVLSAVFTEMSSRLAKAVDCRELVTLHLHDTFGRAAECVHAALDLGVRSFDGSVAGLGGCPYASKMLPDGTIQRAPGNISTELLVQTIHHAGYRTNVDLDKLRIAADFAREIVARSRAAASTSGSGGAPA